MANQPNFRADPNAVPKINGWPGVIDSVQKGYKLAQLPEQMKMEKMLKAAQLAKTQAETTGQENINQYYGKEADQRIAASKAATDYQNKQTSRYDDVIDSGLLRDKNLNANTAAQTSLYNTQASAAQDDLNYQRDLYAAIKAAQSGQPQTQPATSYGQPAPQATSAPQYQPGQGGAPFAAPQQNISSPQAQVGQGGAQQAPSSQQNTNGQQTYLVQEGDPSQYYLDSMSLNPLYAKQLAKMGVSAPKVSTTFNGTSGLMVTTTQLPSGRITTTTTPVTSGSNGIQVSTDDQGRPIVKIGGSASGNRSGGGLARDADGNLISMPTQATQTNLQQRSIGEQVAQPFLKDITDNLPQFQNIGKRGLTAAEGVLNQFGADFDAPSQKAKGEAAITLASEGLLKSFGLYGAHANIEEIKNTLQPKRGESVEGYKRRIIDYADTTIKNAQGATKNLAGIKVGGNEAPKIDEAKVAHLTNNYSLEQLKQMRETAP